LLSQESRGAAWPDVAHRRSINPDGPLTAQQFLCPFGVFGIDDYQHLVSVVADHCSAAIEEGPMAGCIATSARRSTN